MSTSQRIKREAIKILKKTSLSSYKGIARTFEVPANPEFGDLTTRVSFLLSKELHRAPSAIADEIVADAKIPEDSLFSDIKALSGYINFYLNYQKIAEYTLKKIMKEKYRFGKSKRETGKRVIVEFPSVNPGKPWHIGHARNAILGDSVQKLLKFAGFIVEAQDYIDDLGLQVAQVLWGIINFSEEQKPRREALLEKEDQWQGRIYTKVADMFEKLPSVEVEVRELMKKMELGDPAIKRIHHDMVDKCLRAQKQTAFRLRIFHDLEIHESDIVRSGLYENSLKMMIRSDKIEKSSSGPSKGCLVAKLEEFADFKGMKTADKILVRSDGTATYTAKDVAFQLWKFGLIEDTMKYKLWMTQPNAQELWTTTSYGRKSEKFANAAKVINIIGSEQRFPQKVVRYVLKLMGFKQHKNLLHLAYEHLWFKEDEETERFSGRAGSWIRYSVDEVLDEATRRAYEEVDKRNPKMKENKKAEAAEKIGTAAVKYFILKTNQDKVVVFDYDRALSFEGDTGPYIQYANTRIRGILRKAGEWTPTFQTRKLTKQEKQMVKTIYTFPDIVKSATAELKPWYICRYAYSLAKTLDKFYEACSVLRAPTEEFKNFRLTLIAAAKIVFQNVLELIGIEVPERM